ncbi:MAG TPA: FAD-binding oxidoreductase [Solirubrobacteraceae bacterium]
MRLVERGHAGFEEACFGRLFNARTPDERVPAAVLFAASDDDVVAGVRLARECGWQVSVRSGGHSWAGWSVRDDALLIDLGDMREMTCEGEVATARPAVKGGLELAPFLASHGRMFTGGHCESVGIGGFLLQGGQGWNSRRWGWGCENVLAVDVVTADGELVRGDEELLWAARGAGPGFPGVVTRFHLRTYPLTPMFHDTYVFGLDDVEPLLAFLHDVLPRLDVAVEPVVAATRLRTGKVELLLHTTLVAESAQEADRLLAPLDAVPVEPVDHVRSPTTLDEENAAQALQNPEGHRYCADSQWTNASAAELAPLLRDIWSELPTRHSFSIWYGWAPSRPLPDMAFSLEANVYLAAYAIWTDPADDERHRTWVHGHFERLAERVGEGLYIGDSDFSRRPDRFMAQDNFARLHEIRAARDPDGVFVPYLGL